VNLIGEHTDYNLGFVLPMAIDRWCVAAGSPGDGVEGEVRTSGLRGGDLSARYRVDVADAGVLAPWARYAVGALWVVRAEAGAAAGGAVDVMICSSVPVGAGLSSSAAVEVAMGRLACEVWGVGVAPARLAAMAREAENRYAGVPCGIMDQMTAACGSAGSALLIDCRSMEARPVRLPEGVAVVVADSGVRHALASGEYARRAAACAGAALKLGVSSLREADEAMLAARGGRLSEEEMRCARHVVRENARVVEFVGVLDALDGPHGLGRVAGPARPANPRHTLLRRVGGLMVESHQSLRDEYRVSCPEVDAMVERALGVPGVFGSRMTGGGFGGCTVTLCEGAAAGEVCRVLGDMTRGRGAVEPFVAHAVDGAGARHTDGLHVT
jgi:galactokinase